MKFRMLSNEELLALEKDLKHFLIANGVEGDSWKRINEEEPAKAVELVALFSDIVLQKVYEKLEYLELRSSMRCMLFQFEQEIAKLIVIEAPEGVDLSTPESIQEALRNRLKDIRFYRSSKPYSKSREEEIHYWIAQGCTASHATFWTQVNQLITY